jgi:two-component system NtrC family sensor kinase
MISAEQHSIRWLQAVLVAAIVIPLSIFSFATWQSYSDAIRVADDQIARSLNVINEHALKVFEVVERTIAEVNEIIRDMSDDDLSANEAQLHQRLERMVSRSAEMKSIWIFDAQGHARVNSLAMPAPTVDFSDRDYFKAHVSNNVGTYVGQILRPRPPYGGAPFFGISARRISPSGEFKGVIQVSILPEYFEGFYSKLGQELGSYNSLIRSDGFILARFPKLDYDIKLPSNGGVMEAFAANPAGGKLTVTSIVDGLRRTVAYRRLPELPVYVLSGRESKAIRDEWLWHEGQRLLYGLPLTAALVTVIAVALRRTRRLYDEARRRRSAEDALKQAQRLEALGRLTGGVAHDFNNLLMVIAGAADRLRRHLSEEKSLKAVQLIEGAAKKGESLTKRLLAFSRSQSLSPKVVDLSDRLSLIRGVLEQSIRADIRLEIIVPDYPVYVKIDPDDLEIALLNLTLNSRDAMPDGGSITLEMRLHQRRRRSVALIIFSDTGCGIPDAIQDRVFEPFFTTKSVSKGTGLGLSQVYGFVSQSNGSIDIQSSEGSGTTFKISLPLAEEKPSAEAPTHKPRQMPISKVLLVEDNAEVAAVVTDYLIQLNLNVSHVISAEAALELLNNDHDFELVLSDIVMAGMTGLDLARLIRQRHPGLPVILATGYSDKADLAIAEGFPLIRKPYSIDALALGIFRCLPEEQLKSAS